MLAHAAVATSISFVGDYAVAAAQGSDLLMGVVVVWWSWPGLPGLRAVSGPACSAMWGRAGRDLHVCKAVAELCVSVSALSHVCNTCIGECKVVGAVL